MHLSQYCNAAAFRTSNTILKNWNKTLMFTLFKSCIPLTSLHYYERWSVVRRRWRWNAFYFDALSGTALLPRSSDKTRLLFILERYDDANSPYPRPRPKHHGRYRTTFWMNTAAASIVSIGLAPVSERFTSTSRAAFILAELYQQCKLSARSDCHKLFNCCFSILNHETSSKIRFRWIQPCFYS